MSHLRLFPVYERANGTVRPGNPLPEYRHYSEEMVTSRYEAAKAKNKYAGRPDAKLSTVEGDVLNTAGNSTPANGYYHQTIIKDTEVVAVYLDADGAAGGAAVVHASPGHTASSSSDAKVLIVNKLVDAEGVLHMSDQFMYIDLASTTIGALHDNVVALFGVPAGSQLACCIEVMPGMSTAINTMHKTLAACNVSNGEIFVWSAQTTPGGLTGHPEFKAVDGFNHSKKLSTITSPGSILAKIHRISDGAIPVAKGGQFQWLPSIVKVGEDGDVRIQSYINGMEPGAGENQFGMQV